MKIKDLLSIIGIKLEEDVDITSKSTSDREDVELNIGTKSIEVDDNVGDIDSKEELNSVEAVREPVVFIPEYDKTTGLFNLDSIKDETLREVLKLSNDTVIEKENKNLIDNAMNNKLGTIKLAKNISTDAILKLLDTSNIKVEDGKVIGIEEAFDNLKTSNGGLFTTEEESTPVLEGFNPIQKGNANAHIPSSFSDAFAMMEGLV